MSEYEQLDEPAGPEDDVEMGFFEHIGELRTRLVRAVLGVIPGVAVAWAFKEQLLEFFLAPLVHAYDRLGLGEPVIHFANPVEPFIGYVKIAIVCGLVASAPWLFYQLWAFIAPGLYRREKLMAIPFVFFSTLCFAGGAVFGYSVVFPMGFETLLGFAGLLPNQSITMTPTLMLGEYLSFSTRLLLAFGVVFEVPVVTVMLSSVGIVTPSQLLSFGRWWVIIAAVLSALLTPQDVGSMVVMLIPLVGLYFASIPIAWLLRRRKKDAEPSA
ncbi:MAG: twin-arginine translocase subunit TatC [Sandaracinus sp.]|nr:twin-arginine translocase subunit TatC [Sandaracinus sp.]